MGLAGELCAELQRISHSDVRFESFSDRLIYDASEVFATLARYGVDTSESCRPNEEAARAYSFGDFRKADRVTVLHLGFLLNPTRHIHPKRPESVCEEYAFPRAGYPKLAVEI